MNVNLRRKPVIAIPAWVRMFLVVCAAAVTNVAPVTCQTLYRLVFQDRTPDSLFVPGGTVYESTLQSFSPKSLERRVRSGISPVLTDLDRPFNQHALDELDELGVTRGAELRWRNSVVVTCDDVQAMLVRSRPWVKHLEPVSADLGVMSLPDCLPAQYGADVNQLDVINILPLHDAGVYGQGAMVGMIDVGFRWREHPALAHADVQAEWDAVQNDVVTSNQDGDAPEHDTHGTQVMSVAAGWAPGTLVGAAPLASYMLVKTEDLRYERRIEDVHYAAAVEWLERNGVDIISASVGYRYFDSTEVQWPWAAFNGRASFSARAVNQASTLGVVCVTAAGNSGPGDSTIVTPADADSAVSVGAVTPDRTTARFTSRGPTADGRNKPDVLAPGAPLTVASVGEQAYRRVWGTSVATPLVASSLAVLRSMYPERTLWELRDALLRTVQPTLDSVAPLPWAGIIDVMAAAQALGPAVPHIATVRTPIGRSILVPVIGPPGTELRAEARWPGTLSMPLTCTQRDSLWWECVLPNEENIQVRVEASLNDRVARYPADGWHSVSTETVLPCGMRLPSAVVGVQEAALRPSTPVKTVVSRGRQHVLVQSQEDMTTAAVSWIDGVGQRQPATYLQRGVTSSVVQLPQIVGVHVVEIVFQNGKREYHIMMIEP